MTSKIAKAGLRATAAVFLLGFPLASWAELPQGEFACQVQTIDGQAGLVLVQTEVKKEAIRVAETAPALEMDGGYSKSLSVVECIKLPAGEFKDSWFNNAYKNIPR